MHLGFRVVSRRRARRFQWAVSLSLMAHALFALLTRGVPGGPALATAPAPQIIATLERTTRAIVEMPASPLLPRESSSTSREHIGASNTKLAHAAATSAGALRQDVSGGIADATYYGVRQLDVFPAPATPIEITYPIDARSGTTGRVNLLLLISETGRVDEVSVIDAEPQGVFEDEARRGFSGVQFTPAERGGRRVRARLIVEVSFGAR